MIALPFTRPQFPRSDARFVPTAGRAPSPPGPMRSHIPHLGAAGCGAALAAIWVASGATLQVRLTLTVFLVATIAWVVTRLDDTLVALVAALAAIAVGGIAPEGLYAALGRSTVWLLISSFVVAAAATRTGVANRMTIALVRRARSVTGLFRLVALALAASTFVVPATSGRAALALPIFAALARALADARITRALALLFPTIILLSAAGSLLGAGAHLVTAEVVGRMVGSEIGYLRWLVLGGPFALVSCALSTEVILRLFLDVEERQRPLDGALAAEIGEARPWTGPEVRVAAIIVMTVLLWATSGVHGVDVAILAVVAAVAVTAPQVGAVSMADAIDDVPWNLVLFLAATLALGESLVSSGAATWLAEVAFGSFDRDIPAVLVVVVVALVALGSHLVIGSRSARASVLTPLVVLTGFSTGVDPTALAFLAAMAAGYCLTLTVSAKPVAMFASAVVPGAAVLGPSSPSGSTGTGGGSAPCPQADPAYTSADLARLSLVLLPIHLVLLLGFALVVWPLLGLG